MHRPYFHNGYDAHGDGIAEICKECSHDNVLVPVSFCPEAMKYLKAEERLNDLIDKWHGGDGLGQEFCEYLGWTWQEYTHWIENFELPERFVEQ